MPKKKTIAKNVDCVDQSNMQKVCMYREVVECPACHYAIDPKELDSFIVCNESYQYDTYRLLVISQCKRCRHVFMSVFRGCFRDTSSGRLEFSYSECSVPSTPHSTAFSDEIKNVSPGFVETYQQAEVAESQQLTQICGVGYRKALEYLVKDYLCRKNPNNADAICSEMLSASLRRIEDPRIKVLAERSTWIGNDETHYVRKHEDLNVDDMKRFIKAMLSYVEAELAFEEALGIERM